MNKLVILVSLVVVLFSVTGGAGAQTPDEKAAIRQAALDYIEGWYQADAGRMDRALHKELAKRQIFNAGNGERFGNLTKSQMVEATRRGGGRSRPAATWNIKVDVLDVYKDIATVRTECADYIDYLHLAKSEGKWQIVNVLWQNVVTERKQVTVDPKILPIYAGEYELKPGLAFVVTVENGRLFLQPPGQGKMPVYPSSPTDFFVKGAPLEVTFVKNAEGKVTHMVLHEGGDDMLVKKVK